jgi:hypothetical protein
MNTTTARVYTTQDASCPACRALHGQPLPEQAGNISRLEMGHQLYHTATGRTAACLLHAESLPARTN